MLNDYNLIRIFAQKIDKVVNTIAQRYKGGMIADEDDFTSRLLEGIESKLDDWKINGVTFYVRKTTSRGRGTEEAFFGADIVAVVKVDLPGYKADKGILIQAKRLDCKKKFDIREWDALQKQIQKMKKHTLESYVWLYDSFGVRSIKAHTLAGLETRRPDDLYITKCSTFLGEFVQSKHGDPCISDLRDLDQIRDKFSSRSAISISISDNGREYDPFP